ncbi:MAG TPA: PhoD-like phosphatase, partial [Coleofasciculaceae cyanobacterium]
VTAKPIHKTQLEPGHIYAYDLSFGNQEQHLSQALTSALFPQVTVSYFQHQLPTFALPPSDLGNLRIAHGSCRKLHGGGQDALPILDDLIEYYATDPNARLHQMFFTGDQIYGDDVADALLEMATEVGNSLLGWEEKLPLCPKSATGSEYKQLSELKPGQRTDIAREYGGFTAMLLNTPHEAKSHLFGWGEYMAAYLLVWSPILWSTDFPNGRDVYPDSRHAKVWNQEVSHLKECLAQLWKVRRAIANVPTYMIFDDHDISDDWYLNRAWCTDVLGKPLGRRVVQNGLLAYALFQGWGNTPDQFQDGQPGGYLLNAATRWSASAGTDESACQEIGKFLGLPDTEPETGLPKFRQDRDVLILERDYGDGTTAIKWHYTIRSFKHEVIVLDTRTWRGYPLEVGETARILNSTVSKIADVALAPPWLLCPTAFEQQIHNPLELTDWHNQTHESDIEMTFLILPTNIVSLQIIDLIQQWELEKGNVFDSDVGDAWNLNEVALSTLLLELFKRRQKVVVLSGDIHFSAAIRLSYWFRESVEASLGIRHPRSLTIKNRESLSTNITPVSKQQNYPRNQTRVLVQLTASAFKNGELKTYMIHTKAKSLAPEQPQDWMGWSEPPQLVEIQVTPEKVRLVNVEMPKTGPVLRQRWGRRGTWDITWEILPKNHQSLPDWQYHIEWLKREKATVAPWEKQRESLRLSQTNQQKGWIATCSNWVSMLWRNQWLQEGEEVIGYSNFGLISLEYSNPQDGVKAVIQDNYWRPPWNPKSVVYSRYRALLEATNPPAPLKVALPQQEVDD